MKFENELVSYLSITPSAKTQINRLLEEKAKETGKKPIGIRLCIKPRGCSGMKYAIEYAEEGVNITKYDELFIEEEVRIFIDPKISMWLIGTRMDYEETKINSGFMFINPNEKGKCGCGESFYV